MSERVAFIFRTDVHVADNSPSSWKGDYPAEIWNSLEQVGALASKYGAAAVLDGGDYFHVKAPTKNSHRLVARSALLHSRYPCPTYSIEGNHDVKHNNLETITDQPLGVLYESKVFEHLTEATFESGSVKVRVVGFPHSPTRSLAELRSARKREGEFLVGVVHALAGESPPDHVEEFFGEPVFRYQDLVYEGCPDAWLFGHWHRDQGIVKVQNSFFVNQGALSRGALVKENLTRIPKVALLEFTAGGLVVSSIPLQVAPAEEVFNLERKERQDQEVRTVEQFVDRLMLDLREAPQASVEDTIQKLNFATEIGETAMEYLRKARGEA